MSPIVDMIIVYVDMIPGESTIGDRSRRGMCFGYAIA